MPAGTVSPLWGDLARPAGCRKTLHTRENHHCLPCRHPAKVAVAIGGWLGIAGSLRVVIAQIALERGCCLPAPITLPEAQDAS